MKIYGDQGTFRAKSRLGTPRTGFGARQAPAVIARTMPMAAVPVAATTAVVSRGASGARGGGDVKPYSRGDGDKKPGRYAEKPK